MPTIAYDTSQIDFERPGKRHYQVAFHLDGTWGYSLVPLTVINGERKSSGDKPPGIAVIGGTHGNEYEGQIGVKRLCTDLDPAVVSGRVLLIPQLSQSACVANQRESPLDGVNMNRAFPGKPRGTISYRIANFVKTQIFPRVRVVLDLHAGGKEGSFPICTSFHPIPDPKQRAEIAEVAALFDPPFMMIYSSDMASGLLTDEAEAEGKITIGGEFGFGESANADGIRHIYVGVNNVLRRYGLLDGRIERVRPKSEPPPRLVKAGNLEDYRPCPRDGVWEPLVRLGAEVQEGDLLGRLHDFSDHSSDALEVKAHRAGFVLMMYLGARVAKGATLYVIAEETQL